MTDGFEKLKADIEAYLPEIDRELEEIRGQRQFDFDRRLIKSGMVRSIYRQFFGEEPRNQNASLIHKATDFGDDFDVDAMARLLAEIPQVREKYGITLPLDPPPEPGVPVRLPSGRLPNRMP